MLQESCNKKWNDGNWSYKPSFAVNDICWLISLYFTTDHVTRKGNWPIQQVLYLPAFFLVPPLTILTKQCMPFSWFQRLFNVCLIVSRHRRTRFSQEEQPIHTRWCMLKCVGELHDPKEINSVKVVTSETVLFHAMWLIISPSKLQTQKRLLFIFAFRFFEFSFLIFSSSTVS